MQDLINVLGTHVPTSTKLQTLELNTSYHFTSDYYHLKNTYGTDICHNHKNKIQLVILFMDLLFVTGSPTVAQAVRHSK